MTPKQKAFEILWKYIYEVVAKPEKAKICALIAVDEILIAGKDVDKFSDSYWLEVKQEIENL